MREGDNKKYGSVSSTEHVILINAGRGLPTLATRIGTRIELAQAGFSSAGNDFAGIQTVGLILYKPSLELG